MLRQLSLCLLIGAALAMPLIDEPSAPELAGNGYEGDMLEPYEGAFSGLLDTARRWPRGVIVYQLDPSLPDSTITKVKSAMFRVTHQTDKCIKFREATATQSTPYVRIRPGLGCSASVGYRASNVVNLSDRCMVGNIMHEFQHVLGVDHQQSRSDRDKYLSVAYENVTPGKEGSFNKLSASTSGAFGVPYDFGSMMHYSLTSYSKNGQRTMNPLPGKLPNGVIVGQRDRMSAGDIAMLKAMYKC